MSNIVTRGAILAVSLEHKSQYALFSPAVIYHYSFLKMAFNYQLILGHHKRGCGQHVQNYAIV